MNNYFLLAIQILTNHSKKSVYLFFKLLKKQYDYLIQIIKTIPNIQY